jgi:AIPR protein
MSITPRDKKDLDQLYAEYREEYGGTKEDYFALLYLTRRFKAPVEALAHQVAFGNNDYGIDAYYIDRDARNLYLYQFKWAENHNLFKESLDRLTEHGMDRIFGNAPVDPKKNQMLSFLKQDLKECKELIDRVYVQFIFKGDIDSAEQSQGLQERRETLDNQKWRVSMYFGERPVEFIFRFMSDNVTVDPTPIDEKFEIHFTDRALFSSEDGCKRLHVGFVSLMDLFRIDQALGKTFLNRNIRFELPKENSPNKKIREALARIVITGQQPADTFPFHHNGITLAAAKVDFDGEGIAAVQIPRLLNGAQTVSSLKRFLEENDAHPALKKNKATLDRIRVLTKIVEQDPKSDFVTAVTLSNNQQNPVHPWNLRANDKIQCDFQDKFREEVSIYYSRQENAIKALSEAELEDMGIEENRPIEIRPLAQTFLAAQGEIDKMSRLPDVFTIEKLYTETFRSAYLKTPARRIVAAYKIGLMLNSPLKRIEEVATVKLRYATSRARNLSWALLIQAILNSPDLEDLLDDHACDLTKSVEFKNHLRHVASSRIWPIFKKSMSQEPYQARIAEENYNFLRTKDFYKFCMNIAYSEWNWVKQPL